MNAISHMLFKELFGLEGSSTFLTFVLRFGTSSTLRLWTMLLLMTF